MPYLIDGHNLIGRSRWMSLSDPDDESRLAAVLQAWCQRKRVSAIVFFDRGVPGLRQSPPRRGRLTVRFVTPPRTADAAMMEHMARLGKEAPNWTIVSSDREIQQAARRAGARVMESSEFASFLDAGGPGPVPEKPNEPSPEEVDHWLKQFRRGGR